MKTIPGMTRDEARAHGKIRAMRTLWGFLLTVLVIVTIVDGLFLAEEIGGDLSDVPEWLIIPMFIGIFSAAGSLGIILFMLYKLRDRELAFFVRVSIESLKVETAVQTLFSGIAGDLVNNSGRTVIREMVRNGWPPVRAQYYAGLVESLFVKCEWNIFYENQAAGYTDLLIKQKWSEKDARNLINPVIEILKESGGRRIHAGIGWAIAKNILWIVVILILIPALGWVLTNVEGLHFMAQYGYLKKIVFAVFALIGIGFNISAIFRKLRQTSSKKQ